MSEAKALIPSVDPETFLNSAQVRRRYGDVSRMWIERRTADSNFPAPTYLGTRRFWKLAQLIAWEREQAANPPKAKQPKQKAKNKTRRAA